jgi:macrolide transport system ATP-binding/permease protein
METLFKDIRYALRGLLKRPGFAAVGIVSLALGIGANTAIFSLVNTVLLRSLPVDHPEEVVSVSVRAKDDSISAFSYPNYKDFRDRNQVLSGLIAYRFVPLSLSREGNNARVWGYEVSGNYFDVLGVRPIKGRTFQPEEDLGRSAHPVIVISYDCWQRRFGADPNVVGTAVVLNNHQFKVIGIAPAGFKGTEFVYTPEMWLPAAMIEWVEPGATWLDDRSSGNFFLAGRLKSGTGPSQAEASLNLLAQQLAQEYPDTNEGQTVRVGPAGFILPDLRGAVLSFTWILMVAVVLVLLVTCANLAGLLVARAADRRREIGIRLAMGANRFRLIRQLLTESILLSFIGGVLGLLLALWMINLLLAFKPPIDFPLSIDIAVDWRVLVFSLLVSIITGAIFGLAPALQATRPALVTALKESAVQGGGSRRSRLRNVLVVLQIALSLVVLIGGGLVLRTLQQLQTMNPGFNPQNALIMSFDVGLQGYDRAHGEQFYRHLVERVESLPGVKSTAITSYIPLSLNYNSSTIFVEGQPAERGANVPTAMVGQVGPRYFETLATPLLEGREFTTGDTDKSEKVVVVNETFVRRLMPFVKTNRDAIGRRISFNSAQGPFLQIVGIAHAGRYFNIAEDPRSFIWTPIFQSYSNSGILVVRTHGDPESMIAPIRNELRTLDPNLPIFEVKTLTDHLRLAFFPSRVAASVLGAFGIVALLLAAMGIYGVTSYAVAQRTHEIGIRMALGAQLADVLKLILNHGVRLILIGVGLGLAGAYLVTRAITSLLYGVSATDPLTFILVSLMLAAVALIACYIPARRATKVDPLVALRYE